MTFQEELIALLKKHGIAYEERYLWSWFLSPLAGLRLSEVAPFPRLAPHKR
jgi:hypothetical protein